MSSVSYCECIDGTFPRDYGDHAETSSKWQERGIVRMPKVVVFAKDARVVSPRAIFS